MNRNEADLADEVLNKIQKMIRDEGLISFSAEEAATLQEVAKLWGQIKGVVALGSILGNSLKWLVGFAVVWVAFKEGLADNLKALIK